MRWRAAAPIEEALEFRLALEKVSDIMKLLELAAFRDQLLAAAGFSTKARNHLSEQELSSALKRVNSAGGADDREPTMLANRAAYLACGELKGGIDPAGADEHWKTAKSALDQQTDISFQVVNEERRNGAGGERSRPFPVLPDLRNVPKSFPSPAKMRLE